MSDKNQLITKLNIAWMLIISVIIQCTYSETVVPIEVSSLVYTYVTGFVKTFHVRTKTEIHFIEQDYSYPV